MKYSRSGEYKLPSPIYSLVGNLVLRMVRWFPAWVRYRFVSRHSTYQVFSDTEVCCYQGLSIKKWQALQLPSDLKGKSVIDIGCAEGFFCLECAKRGATPVLGVDSGLGRLIHAQSLALQAGLNIQYKICVFPSHKLQGKFDYVLCLSVLHHFLPTKNVWKVLVMDEFADDLAILREQLKLLRSLTADKGKCILELPYEYDDPEAERQVVDFQIFNEELKAAGFERACCLGTWDYNPKHRVSKDRIIYVAEAQ